MPSTTSCRFGDIALVPFPFTDQSATKRRPAVVVSSAAFHRFSADVILMAVTTRTWVLAPPGEVVFRNWREAGLMRPSQLKPILTTLDRRLVVRTLGRLQAVDRAAVQRVLDQILGE